MRTAASVAASRPGLAMLSRRSFTCAAAFVMACLHASAQLSGPPAGVPVPPAPIASEAPKTISPADAAPDSHVFRVRVVDGRNGSALANAHLRLWYDDATGSGYALATDKHGVAVMPEPVGLPIRVLVSPIDRIDCRKVPENEPALGYNLQEIAAKGVAAENHCGDAPGRPRPGELVIFVRPVRWYEGINRGTP